MLTLLDCIELSELTEEEIQAIAQHEHIPEIAALELGNYLVQSPSGEKLVSRMIADDIQEARRSHDYHRAASLKLCLKHYLERHGPEARTEHASSMKAH